MIAIVNNLLLSSQALDNLYFRNDLHVGFRRRMAHHPNASKELLWKMANQEDDKKLLQGVVDHLAADEESKVLALLLIIRSNN